MPWSNKLETKFCFGPAEYGLGYKTLGLLTNRWSERGTRYSSGEDKLSKDLGGKNDDSKKRFYHGTRAELKPGDQILPSFPRSGGVGNETKTRVYLSPNLDEAVWDAELSEGAGPSRVYQVEVTGPVGNVSDFPGEQSPGHPSMSCFSCQPLRVVGEVTEWLFYHGTKADLKPGELITPGQTPNFGQKVRTSIHVYLTRTLDAAIWGAELAAGEGRGRVYTVQPIGPIEEDPNLTDKKFRGNPTKSFRSREPLKVTGEVTHWKGHNQETIKAMKDGFRLGLEPIDD